MNALEEAKAKTLSVSCLKSMKQQKTFRQLSRETGMPAGVLNRYINGSVLPKPERAEKIIDYFSRNYFDRLIQAAHIKGSRFIVTSDILSKPFFLSIIAHKAARMLKGRKIDKVFTAAVDGIPLATEMASRLNCSCIYAKKTQELALSDHYVSKSTPAKPLSSPFYLPKNLLKRNESVLIVDDVIRGGTTFDALTSICGQAKADIVGIFSMFITRKAYRELKRKYDVKYLLLVD
ncbi:helix-turn-helix domain-containing protein [Candidatus Woesearchaeota archaeon]|nr:helix-turn-helix domain-containing protein [Candidatus Woesearchaeota archaeon]